MTGTQQPPARVIQWTEAVRTPSAYWRARGNEAGGQRGCRTRTGGPRCRVNRRDPVPWRDELQGPGGALAGFWHRVYLVDVREARGRSRFGANQRQAWHFDLVEAQRERAWRYRSLGILQLACPRAGLLRNSIDFVDMLQTPALAREPRGRSWWSSRGLRNNQRKRGQAAHSLVAGGVVPPAPGRFGSGKIGERSRLS